MLILNFNAELQLVNSFITMTTKYLIPGFDSMSVCVLQIAFFYNQTQYFMKRMCFYHSR